MLSSIHLTPFLGRGKVNRSWTMTSPSIIHDLIMKAVTLTLNIKSKLEFEVRTCLVTQKKGSAVTSTLWKDCQIPILDHLILEVQTHMRM